MGTRLFIGNLSYNVNEQELKEAFTSEGIEVRSVRLSLDRETGRPRGFAFVETATDEGAKESIQKLTGKMLQGRSIVVEEAQARPAGGAGGARPMGPGGPPRPGGPSGPPGAGGPARGFGPPRTGGFGPPPGPGGAPRPGGFGPPGGGGAARPGGFGPPRAFGSPPPFSQPGAAKPAEERRRERPEKKKSTRPKPEEQERGNWRWDGSDGDD